MSDRGEISAPDTRSRLINAAEVLFAKNGIDGVSLREINRVSGARNAVAVQYHFTDRSGVVRAVLEKHRQPVELARHAMLDQLGDRVRPSARAYVAALVKPLASKLADPDGGPEFLQIYAELVNRPRPVFDAAKETDPGHSMGRWRQLVAPYLDDEALRLHRRFTAIRFTAVELGRRAAAGPHEDDRLFVSHLVDLVTALLGARLGPETQRLNRARQTPGQVADDTSA